MEVFQSESDELSQQLPSTTVSRTQELGPSILSGSVSSGPALASAEATSPSGAPQLPEDDINKIIENLFTRAQIDKMHYFYRCRSTGCTGISKEELDRLKMTKNKDRFQHEWLFWKETSFCSQTGIWCLVYVETAFFAVNIKASQPRTEAKHSQMGHPLGSNGMQSPNT